MAEVHFFTETGDKSDPLYPFLINSEKFGPISDHEYLVTSIHQWSGADPKAYAVLPGVIRYQQDMHNPNLVNAILKLDLEPKLQGLSIKYFIYRGIKRDSLLSNQTDLINPNNLQLPDNHIIKKIWDSIPDASTDYLTLGLGIKDNADSISGELQVGNNEYLDKLFTHNYDKIPWRVYSGTILGHFDKDNFGLEIVLDASWNKPKISIVRDVNITQGGHKIEINSTDPDYQQKSDREKVLNYLDPVCFWSLFYNDKVYVETEKLNGSKKIYENILSLYQNKNRIYLDIRNDNNLSLNYYENYENIGLKENNSTIILNYSTNSWPIHILDTFQYISMNSGEDSTKIELALPLGDNSMNICFIMYGRIYKKMKGLFGNPIFNFILKESKIPKNEERFLELMQNFENSTITEYFNISTFQYADDQNNNYPVAAYIRLLYGKQLEAETIKDNSNAINAGHILDNLFILRSLDDLMDIKEMFGFRAWFDGNIRYIARDDLNNKGKGIYYSGIYQTGIAIGGGNITLFAIPYAIDGKRGDQVKVEVPSAGSLHELNFMDSLTSGNKGKIKFQNLKLKDALNNEYSLLSLYDDPDPEKTRNSDSEAFLGVTFTEAEYETMTQHLATFENDLHPTFLQILNDKIPTNSIDGISIREIELQLTGYKEINNSIKPQSLELINGNMPRFYGLAVNGSQYFNTNSAAENFNAPITIFPSKINIGHSNDTEEYDEIRNALILTKIYLRQEFYQIQKLISSGRIDTIPILKHNEDNATIFEGSKKELRKYKILLKYDDLDDSTTGETSTSSAMIAIENAIDQYKKSDYGIRWPIEGFLNNNNDYINYDLHESIATDNNNSPKDIANLYVPEISIYSPESGYSNLIPINKPPLIDSGRALINEEITINLNKNILRTLDYPNEPLKIEIGNLSTTIQYKFKDSFRNIGYRELVLSQIIAHEFGHALYAVEKPLSYFSWQILEAVYKYQPNSPFYDEITKKFLKTNPKDENFPSFTGDGHLEGNPSGNIAAEYEYHIGKNMIENDLWKQGEKLIDTKGSDINYDRNIYNLKVAGYSPLYLEVDISQPNYVYYKVRKYLSGNLYLDLLPDKIKKP